MAIETVIFQTLDYVFSSPRYHAVINLATDLYPENYQDYDNINRSYDKYFPCYTLNQSDPPQLTLTDQFGQKTSLSGDLTLFLAREKRAGKRVGRKEDPDTPSNAGLEAKTVYYSEYLHNKLHPGWTSLLPAVEKGEDDKNRYSPYLLIRALGNSESLATYFAVNLDSYADQILTNLFPIGFIAAYKKQIWRCIAETDQYPTADSEAWQPVDLDNNVFNADVFALTAGSSAYMLEVRDPSRTFAPQLADETLVSWNVSYFHT